MGEEHTGASPVDTHNSLGRQPPGVAVQNVLWNTGTIPTLPGV